MGINLKIFDLLSKSEKPLSLDEISRETNADIVLIGERKTNTLFSEANLESGRLMRYLSSVGMLEEITVDQFASTNVTEALANPGRQAGVRFLLVSLHRLSPSYCSIFPSAGLSSSCLVSLMPK